jgi:Bacteriophage tail sheath protein
VPITPTYPGVYIEELPSTVHTIVGVSTSVTAFVGYTKRGPADQPTHIYSFGDFQRNFSDLDPDCPLTYAVQQFFTNGGTEAWIVRVANGASEAAVTLAEKTAGGTAVLTLTASSSGAWANVLRATVDRGTLNPDSLFNLTVTSYKVAGGKLVPDTTERFRNLSMNSASPADAVAVINSSSHLVTAARPSTWPPAALTAGDAGYSLGGASLTGVSLPSDSTLQISFKGEPPVEITFGPTGTGASQIRSAIQAAFGPAGLNDLTASVSGSSIQITDSSAAIDERSSVRVLPGSTNDASVALGFGYANGGHEVDAIAKYTPASTGTVGEALSSSLPSELPGALPSAVARTVDVTVNVLGTAHGPYTVQVLSQGSSFATKEDLRAGLQTALQNAAITNTDVSAELAGASVSLVADQLVVAAGGRADTTIELADGGDTVAGLIGFAGNTVSENVAAYSPATGGPTLGQLLGNNGSDGLPATATDVIGDEHLSTGIYALSHVDLFNLLVLPDIFQLPADNQSIATAAMAYCEQRRAFLIQDVPPNVGTAADALTWITDPDTPKSANAAAYFPRLDFPDPMQGNRARSMPSAGAIAGLYARIDTSRGVWKAPAGTEATLRGPVGMDVVLNDAEQGSLNPLGLNVNRAFPVYGNVVWGARTLDGADQLASQWKYIPVRRLALYIEESLFRGTKWAVFEPNDEPLWGQLRLSVGTFMHNLFRQHAFEGASPRQAYLVKCDSETTTQADIDLGVVNIIVGFAPLKPAEFVVIQITQLAGQLDV